MSSEFAQAGSSPDLINKEPPVTILNHSTTQVILMEGRQSKEMPLSLSTSARAAVVVKASHMGTSLHISLFSVYLLKKQNPQILKATAALKLFEFLSFLPVTNDSGKRLYVNGVLLRLGVQPPNG